MKKSLLFLTVLLGSLSAQAGLFGGGDGCGCEVEPSCEAPVCYDCAEPKPEVIVQLAPCQKKNMPYNYATYEKASEKVIAGGSYNWDFTADGY